MLIAIALSAIPCGAIRLGAATWLQGRARDVIGAPAGEGSSVTLGSGAPQSSSIARGSLFVLDKLAPGSRDRLCSSFTSLGTTCNETRYIPLTPATFQSLTILPSGQLAEWRSSVSMEGDGTLGAVFGVVQGASGAPVAGATITINPPSGALYYFDSDGTLCIGASTLSSSDSDGTLCVMGETSSSGRFLVLDTLAGDFVASAEADGTTIGMAYSVASDRTTTAVTLLPPITLAGRVVDSSGNGLSGATVFWDFDGAVSSTSSAGGDWTLTGVARGLDLTLRAAAAGFKAGATFRAAACEGTAPSTCDPGAPPPVTIGLLAEAEYANLSAALGQQPPLGLILGRVPPDADGTRAGAVVSVEPFDPMSGTAVRYFDDAGNPDPSLTATSNSGKFAIVNVPSSDCDATVAGSLGGGVVLSAVAPGVVVRSAVAPSICNGVTQGDLVAYEPQTVTGRVFDEQFRTSPVGGAIVQVVEFPTIATIAASNGSFTLTAVPKNTLVSLRAAKKGFKDTYTFRRDSGSADNRSQDIFLISDVAVSALYGSELLAFNSSRGLVGGVVGFDGRDRDGDGTLETTEQDTGGVPGLQAETVPISGTVRYPSPAATSKTRLSTSIIGNFNVLDAAAGESAVAVTDPRSDFMTFELAPLRANAATVDALPIPCADSPSGLSNLYPCDGAVIGARAARMDFLWMGDPMLTGLKFQVQFSTDPNFLSVQASSKSSEEAFLSGEHWKPSASLWKRIRRLGADGVPVYWRVVQRQKGSTDKPSSPFSFTVR